MKPVYQTRHGNATGNCYICCLSSITEIELDKLDVIQPKENFDELTLIQRAQIASSYYGAIELKLKKEGYSTLKIGYNSFLTYSKEVNSKPTLYDIHNMSNDDFLKLQEKNDKDVSIICLPSECHCILHLNYKSSPVGHCIVGYMDEKYNLKIIHDPSPPINVFLKWFNLPNKEKKWDLENLGDSIEFLVKQ